MQNFEVAAWFAVGVALGYYIVKHYHATGGRVV